MRAILRRAPCAAPGTADARASARRATSRRLLLLERLLELRERVGLLSANLPARVGVRQVRDSRRPGPTRTSDRGRSARRPGSPASVSARIPSSTGSPSPLPGAARSSRASVVERRIEPFAIGALQRLRSVRPSAAAACRPRSTRARRRVSGRIACVSFHSRLPSRVAVTKTGGSPRVERWRDAHRLRPLRPLVPTGAVLAAPLPRQRAAACDRISIPARTDRRGTTRASSKSGAPD